MPWASLGGAYGLVELVLDLDYILELEWICGKMDTHYESFRVIKIIPWRYGILVSIRYSKLHFSLLCFKLQSRSWCIPLYGTTKLVDHRRRQPELITSYQLIQGHLKTWLAGHMQADERGPLPHISFIPMARINPEKLLMTKWTAVETKRTALYYNQTDTCNR